MAEIKPFTPKKTITDLIIESLHSSSKTYTDLKIDIKKQDAPVARGIKALIELGIIVKNDQAQYTLNKSHKDYKKTMQRHLLYPDNEKIYPILLDRMGSISLNVFANGPKEKGFDKYVKDAFNTHEFDVVFGKIAATLTVAHMKYIEDTKDSVSQEDMIAPFLNKMGVHIVLSETPK